MSSAIQDVLLENCTITGNCKIAASNGFLTYEPASSILTQTSIYDIAKDLVIHGLKQMSSNELAEILCNNLISEIDDSNEYKNLLQLTNNDYLHVLKCILEGKKCQK